MKLLWSTRSTKNALKSVNSFWKREKHVSADEINRTGYLPFPKDFATRAIHAAQEAEQWSNREVVTPIVTSTNFKHTAPNEFEKFTYGRLGNPTRSVLQNCLASLENGKHAFCTSSGLAAVTAVLGILRFGDHIICGDDMYAGVSRCLTVIGRKFGMKVSVVDAGNISAIERLINKDTQLIWTESPTNPTQKIIDIEEICKIAQRNKMLSVIDATFSTPFLQRPLDLGADIVMHSMSKYLNGHSDVIMGALVTNRDDLYLRLRYSQNNMGMIASPFDSYLALRSLKTLELRMRKHMENAFAIAHFLESHPKIERVIYPGLASHPQHELYKQQASGPSGMISFYVKGGLKETKKFFENLKIITLAESLGGYESLVELPFLMTHADLSDDEKEELRISENFVRLSVGLEDVNDLQKDIDRALMNI